MQLQCKTLHLLLTADNILHVTLPPLTTSPLPFFHSKTPRLFRVSG